jgi:hypothetical protein
MARWRQAVELAMTVEEIGRLAAIARSRSEPTRRVERARMLLAYCESPSFYNNTIWMRWRCAAAIFQPSAVLSRRTSALLHLAICFPRIRWRKRITAQGYKTISSFHRFKPLWRRYKKRPNAPGIDTKSQGAS